MNQKRVSSLIVLLLTILILLSCVRPTSNKIGTVTKLTPVVQAGPTSSLVTINNSADLNSGDSVCVSGGNGRASLSLVGGSVTIVLYEASESSTKASGSAAAIAYLSQGGLKTTVKEGATCTVQVPNGTFNIIGTEAFVIYNPQSGYATVGNFEGTVLWSSVVSDEQNLLPGTMVDIAPDGRLSQSYPLPFGVEEFERTIDETGSPIESLYILRDRHQIPQPGDPGEQPSEINTLVTRDGEQLLPGLAERWAEEGSLDENGVVWTFYLRQNVTLNNGEPFIAPYAAEVIASSASPQAIEQVDIYPIDDYTLVIQFLPREERNDATYLLLDELTTINFEIMP